MFLNLITKVLAQVYSELLIRTRRDDNKSSKPKPYLKTDPKLFLAFNSITIQVNKSEPVTVNGDLVELAVNPSTNQTLIAANLKSQEFDIGFKIQLSGGSWAVSGWKNKNKRMFTNHKVQASDNRSFGCIDLKLSQLSTDDSRTDVSFSGFQSQPFFHQPLDLTKPRFGIVNDCTGVFSIPILSAMLIISVFISVLSIGIIMMLNIANVDRYDNEKTKKILYTDYD